MAPNRESPAALRVRARRIVRRLQRLYPDADCELRHASALQLLVATILSAQCTDERVNRVTPALFRRFPDAGALAQADVRQLEPMIQSTGFFRSKTRSLIGLGRALVEQHAGEVPASLEALVRLPGVGRKTANVILGTWFGRPAITVDTHVARLAQRLQLSEGSGDPVRIELELQQILPQRRWTFTSHALIWHGRRVCRARRPACETCGLRPDCPYPDR